MRSLQVKFITLVVGLLVTACVGLAWIATQHERTALQSEVGKRARALVRNLAGDAKEPLLVEDDLTLDALVAQAGQENGVVEARLLVREGKVAASLAPEERGTSQRLLASPAAEGDPGTPLLAREGSRLFAAAPIIFSGVQVGEAQVALDLDVLVEPVVRESTRQLTLVALVVVGLGIVGGSGFVTLLVRPIQRLRSGVEQLAAGDFTVRVPPTSRDEVGQLTRAFNEMGESLLKKDRVQNAFGRYVSDYVLSQLLESADGAELGGAEREVTILFADVRRFTRLSEGMKARDVVALLNEVFQRFSERILAAGGTIDKFIGDSVMAYFGAPAPQSDQALRAVKAAIEIQRSMAERSRSLASRPGKASDVPVEIGIGIHTGVVIVGNIGSDRRMDYTAVGDAVNVAHRLEKLAPPGEILVSEAVQRRVRGTIRLRFEGERQLSGRQEPVHVYAVELGAEPGGAALP